MEKNGKQPRNGNITNTEKTLSDTKVQIHDDKTEEEKLPIFGFSYLNPKWTNSTGAPYIDNVEKTIPKTMKSETYSDKILLDKMGDDVKFLAPFFIHNTEMDKAEKRKIVEKLLEYNGREIVHQEFINLLSSETVDEDEIKMYTDKHPEIPKLYIQEHNTISGFPLYFVAQKFVEDEHICLARMKLLLNLGSELNARHRNEPTALHYAAEQGMWKVVQFLIEKGACDIDEGKTRDLIAETEPQLAKKLEILTPNTNSLFEALYVKNEEKFQNVLENQATVDLNDGKETLLQLAVSQRLENVVEKLIGKGVDVNKVSGCHLEPIILALRNENLECLEKLLNHPKINLRVAHSTETIFHEIARISNTNFKNKVLIKKLIKKALSQSVSLHAVNSNDQTAFDIMVKERDSESCTQLLSCFFPFLDGRILHTIPPSKFDIMFDRHITYEENSRKKEVTLNYDFLKCDNQEFHEPEMPIFYQMSKIKQYKEVLAHPLIKLFLIYKCKKVIFVSILHLIFYLLFAFTLSVHVYKLTQWKDMTNATTGPLQVISAQNVDGSANYVDDDDNPKHLYTYIVGGFFWCIIFLCELYEFSSMPLEYLKNWENVLDIALLIFSLISYIPRSDKISYLFPGLAIVMAYMVLTLLIGKFFYTGSIGLYIEMFKTVTLQTFKVLTTFVAVIFSFAFGFFVIFHDSSASGKNAEFNSIWDSVLRTSGMAIGELNLDEINTLQDKGKEILLLIYIIFIPIILLNLLNALAISDTQNILNKSGSKCYIKNIMYYARIEEFFMSYNLRHYNFETYMGDKSNNNKLKKWSSSLAVVFPQISSQSNQMNEKNGKPNPTGRIRSQLKVFQRKILNCKKTELKFEQCHNNIYKLVREHKRNKNAIRKCMSAISDFVCSLLPKSLRPNTICLEIVARKCGRNGEFMSVQPKQTVQKINNIPIEENIKIHVDQIENIQKQLEELKNEMLTINKGLQSNN